MVKTSVVASCVILAAIVGASAADLNVKKSPKAPVQAAPVASSWSSCFLGINGGAAQSKTDVVDEIDPTYVIANLKSTAFAAGGQLGCDYQLSNNSRWVVGVQGMFDVTGLSDSATGTDALESAVLEGKIPAIASATARAGYLMSPDLLIYGRGGWAWAGGTATLTSLPLSLKSSFNQNGWTAGAGVETNLMSNVSLFAEYNYLALSDVVVTFSPGSDKGRVQQDAQTLLLGVNLRFASH